MFKKILTCMFALTLIAYGIGFYKNVIKANASDELNDEIIYRGNNVDITVGDKNTNGVTDDTVFAGYSTVRPGNFASVFSGNDETNDILEIQKMNSGDAFVIKFAPVAADTYDFIEIRVAINNWTPVIEKAYVYSSKAKQLTAENAVYQYDISKQSTGEKLIKLDPELLKGEDGKVSSVTFKKLIPSTAGDQGYDYAFIDYVRFGNYKPLKENQLSDCTSDSLEVLHGTDYDKCVLNSDPSIYWITNKDSGLLPGSGFESNVNKAEDGNIYKIAWASQQGITKPSVFFRFPRQGEINPSYDINIRMYISSDIDDGVDLWFTPSSSENVWTTAKKISVDSLKKDEWITVSTKAKYFMVDGKIGDMCFTVNLKDGDPYYTPSAAFIMFDDFELKEVDRVVAPSTSYSIDDISKVIPMKQEGCSFTGSWKGGDFDFSNYTNAAFTRKDCDSTALKFKLSVNEFNDDFNFYFVMRGVDKYYDKGGIFYWFSNKGISLGSYQTKSLNANYPVSVSGINLFDVEIASIPYRVDGSVSGYYAYLKINGEKLLEEYYDNASLSFGRYFGMYLHNTNENITVTIKPSEYSSTNDLKVNLVAPDGESNIAVGDYVRFLQKIDCNFIGQDIGSVKILEGADIAEIDEDGYLVAKKPGVVKVGYTLTNDFGQFQSNELTFTIGNGSETDEKKGCKSSANACETGLSVLLLVCGGSLIMKNRKKRKENK